LVHLISFYILTKIFINVNNSEQDFLVVNSTLAILILDTWDQDSCPILYFVIEYKLTADNTWIVGQYKNT